MDQKGYYDDFLKAFPDYLSFNNEDDVEMVIFCFSIF